MKVPVLDGIGFRLDKRKQKTPAERTGTNLGIAQNAGGKVSRS